MDPKLIVLKKTGETGIYSPFLLTDHKAVENAIDYMEKRLNNSYLQVKDEYPPNLCDSIKISRALFFILFTYFYSADRQVKSPLDVSSLRLRLFDYVNEQYTGYIPNTPQQQQEIFQQLKEVGNLEVSPQEIGTLVFSDHLENLVIHRLFETPPTVDEVITAFNRDLLNSLLRNASTIVITLDRPLTGNEYRKAYYIGSRSGVSVDFVLVPSEKSNSKLQITLDVADELIERNIFTKKRLEQLFYYIWGNYQYKITTIPNISCHYRKSLVLVTLKPLLPYFPPEKITEDALMTFDSTIEQIFFKEISRFPHLKAELIRDAEIITVTDGVIIPDFQLNFHGYSLFVEIVGFWTEHYKQRKIKRLEQLPPEWQEKLLLIVDKKLNFPQVLHYPTYYYQNNKLPLKKIAEFLYRWQERIYQSVKKELCVTIKNDLESIVSTSKGVAIADLQIKWHLHTLHEAQTLLKEIWDEHDYGHKLVFMPHNWILSQIEVDIMVNQLEEQLLSYGKIPIPKSWLIKQLPSKIPPYWIDRLLTIGNFRVDYKNLVDVMITPKNNIELQK